MVSIYCIDVGLGTQDILFYDSNSEHLPKIVLPSATQIFARRIRRIKEPDILITGGIIGGGPISRAVKEKIESGRRVMSTLPAAYTFSYDPNRIKSAGIGIIQDQINNAEEGEEQTISLQEIDWKFLGELADKIEFLPEPEIIVFAVQDHGRAPKGISPLVYRHHLLRGFIDKDPKPASLLFEASNIPEPLLRMKSVAGELMKSFKGKVYATDTVIAATIGASQDSQVKEKKEILTVDIGNGHTFAALIIEGMILGYFETHTKNLTPQKLERFINLLNEGTISHEQIIKEGGHGAYVSDNYQKSVESIVVTGPRREIIKRTNLSVILGNPLDDNMMTGCAGLEYLVKSKEDLNL